MQGLIGTDGNHEEGCVGVALKRSRYSSGTAGRLKSKVKLSNPNEFEGGGTNLCDPYDVDVHLKQGMCLSHYGFLAHSGRRITSGKRFILVAFMQVQDMYLRYSNGSNPFLRTVHEMGCCTIC